MKVTKSFQYGRHTVTLETGEVARQADGAVIVNMDDGKIEFGFGKEYLI